MMTLKAFKHELMEGIPNELPPPYEFNTNLNHAPKREKPSIKEKKLALKNALRYSLKTSCRLARICARIRRLRTYLHVAL